MVDNKIQISTTDPKDGENKFVDKRRRNIKSDLIEITQDKLENILLRHLEKMGTRNAWVLPLGILLSVSLSICTAEFKDTFELKASVWKAIFIVIAFLSFIWFIVSLIRMITCWNKASLEYLVNKIRNVSEDDDKGKIS